MTNFNHRVPARWMSRSVACVAMAGMASAHADGRDLTALLPSRYAYDLRITAVQDGPLLENQPIEVDYALDVHAFHLRGALPAARQGQICGADMSNCQPVGLLTEGRHVSGKTTTTTVAGALAPLRIVVASPQICAPGVECFGTDLLMDATVTRPVAARYTVWLDRFQIDFTRARHNDTVWVTLRGLVDGQRSAADDACTIYGQTSCLYEKLGDFNNGQHAQSWPIPNAKVGPFDIVPEIDGDLRVAFNLLNYGFSDTEAGYKDTMDTINAAAGAAMQAAYGAAWGGVEAFTATLNAMITPDCDGPTFVGQKVFLNKNISPSSPVTLEAATRATGVLQIPDPTQTIKSQQYCGRSSEYSVSWSVHRDSWKAP